MKQKVQPWQIAVAVVLVVVLIGTIAFVSLRGPGDRNMLPVEERGASMQTDAATLQDARTQTNEGAAPQ